MKNLLVLFVLLSGFVLNQLQAQTPGACAPCPPGCCKATCLPDGSCKVTDANGATTICTPAQMKACAQTAAACTPSPACKASNASEAGVTTPQPNTDKLAATSKLVATRQEK